MVSTLKVFNYCYYELLLSNLLFEKEEENRLRGCILPLHGLIISPCLFGPCFVFIHASTDRRWVVSNFWLF